MEMMEDRRSLSMGRVFWPDSQAAKRLSGSN